MNQQQQYVEWAMAACAEAGVRPSQIELVRIWTQTRLDSNSTYQNGVFRLGAGQMLKLYGPSTERQFHVERALLHALDGVAEIPTPRLVAAGEPDGQPPFIVMSEIEGESLEVGWDGLTRAEQLRLAAEIGRMTAVLHQLPLDSLTTVEQQFGGRAAEVTSQKRERRREIEVISLSAKQKAEVLAFLDEDTWTDIDEAPVLNHYDFSHAHIFAARVAGRPVISGMIDWAEAMCGPAEWDLVYHWLWTFSVDQEAMRVCLEAYYEDGRWPDKLAQRCFTALFYSFSMGLLWDYFIKRAQPAGSLIEQIIEQHFPAAVFG